MAALLGLLFLFMPELDLAFTELFYSSAAGFTQNGTPWERALYESVDWIVGIAVVGAVGVLVLEAARRGPFRHRGKVAALLLVVLALGPGLIVNGTLKEHWGRARPRDVTQFGGDRAFTPALVIADQCERNCSFSAGHPSAGFALAALGYAWLSRRRRWAIIASATGFGLLVGLARVAAGGHFLSDVLFSGVIVIGLTVVLGDRWLGPPSEP
ncbi:MAG: phosphatase PAP2 family protein [marine benthic group bacterium]|jgi:lipid A 4'-phosphatase|nr:phosphatase PAP2 family protein [Gemmatimonadota bacterium]MCL7962588.1 phosphatase PAP2 family protein [Candidatus Carthagonibacter metallireducens]MCL7967113.1 phosphatase PAP2 family protein [Gemmatimonadota bacterium]MCL7975000.1 phosphatase PAP2 family protein [Gemmatimonadota bacterium]MCL7989574.1 phosphatase PAP2 family protein [Gemmatimonadota bacterium]